jgi:DNA-binding GntR family transcriptional regulator
MAKIVNNQRFLNGKETMALLGTSKQSFYDNARRHLKPYHFDAKRSPWYSEAEVLHLKNGVAVRKGAIRLTNIQHNWMQDIIDMGYDARTENRGEVEIVPLPDDAITTFHLPPTQHYVRRSRMTLVDDAPICLWSSYYPLNLVEGEILDEMRRNVATDVVTRMKEVHGAIIRVSRERYTTRVTTPEEQALLRLVTDDPVLILQRASYTQEKQSLVVFSDMTLLGSWFASEREYEVTTWG